jgi:hypothetical protein
MVTAWIGAHFAGAPIPPSTTADHPSSDDTRQEIERERAARQKAEAEAQRLRDDAEARRKADEAERERQAKIKAEQDAEEERKAKVAVVEPPVAPKAPPVPSKVPKPTMADAQRLMQSISSDKGKLQTYCELIKVIQQIDDTPPDDKTQQDLQRQLDALEDKLGPDWRKLNDGAQQIDENSPEGKEIFAAFGKFQLSTCHY